MSGDHNMHQKTKSYLDDFECPRCGHCCQALVDETAKRKHIKTWYERCEDHPDHQTGMISERMIQERMQEEIDELRKALETEREWVGLTDEEVSDVIDDVLEGGGWLDVARALEAAIKRKNI